MGEITQPLAQAAALKKIKNPSSSSVHPSLNKWSVMACKVSWPRQEGVKSLISPPQKKFLLEASLCWFPAFLPNALFLLIRALEYQGQLFPCHWHISCHSHADISPPPHALLRSFQLFMGHNLSVGAGHIQKYLPAGAHLSFSHTRCPFRHVYSLHLGHSFWSNCWY